MQTLPIEEVKFVRLSRLRCRREAMLFRTVRPLLVVPCIPCIKGNALWLYCAELGNERSRPVPLENAAQHKGRATCVNYSPVGVRPRKPEPTRCDRVTRRLRERTC